jgi:hypothetical protein
LKPAQAGFVYVAATYSRPIPSLLQDVRLTDLLSFETVSEFFCIDNYRVIEADKIAFKRY